MSKQGTKRRQSSSSQTLIVQPNKKQRNSSTSVRQQVGGGRDEGLWSTIRGYLRPSEWIVMNQSSPSKHTQQNPTPSPGETSPTASPAELHSEPTLTRITSSQPSSASGPTQLSAYQAYHDKSEQSSSTLVDSSSPSSSNVEAGPSRLTLPSPPQTPLAFDDSDDVVAIPDKQSRSPSRRAKLAKPSRPVVTGHDLPQRRYPWENPRSSPSTSSTSSRSGRGHRRSKYRTNMRSREEIDKRVAEERVRKLENDPNPNVGKAAARIRSLFSGKATAAKINESMMSSMMQTGLNSKEALQRMLSTQTSTKPTLEERITPARKQYRVEVKKQIGLDAYAQAKKKSARDLSQVLDDLKVEDEKFEKLLQARLQPKVPTKLSADKEAAINDNLRNPAFKVTLAAAEVNANSIRRLKPGTWLDDEIMNAYCGMMADRAKADGSKRKAHFMNSFFYQKLAEQGYEKARLKRWTKKIDIFGLDVLVFPINLGNMHWTACAINFENKRIEYYDSMGDGTRNRREVFRAVREYLDAEHREKKGQPFDFTGWEDHFNNNTPQQDNGSDCGVFSCQTLEMITRGRDLVKQGFEFGAKDMPFLRRLMIWEIGKGKLEKREWGQPNL
ncbi:hypothetical protein CI109_107321 [Kwoniella shandongensis]|uniref:Uncharacterized protein n=1 Tax=Kwoniella shandongensis TaxID=1734106 RepID=A0A5M6BVV2_9TREE|nr:uncharacterized protein CI109_004751 [Kwoniella shandongensis]KAA5526974.1 hypothetical protein CI109_004751 [Kwoniella shandongensis]